MPRFLTLCSVFRVYSLDIFFYLGCFVDQFSAGGLVVMGYFRSLMLKPEFSFPVFLLIISIFCFQRSSFLVFDLVNTGWATATANV